MSSLKIHIVQLEIFWKDKNRNYEHIEGLLNNLPPTDLIVLPEMFNTGFVTNPIATEASSSDEIINWMQSVSSKHGCAITGSALTKVESGLVNRLYWVEHEGNNHHYDKHHLFLHAGEGNFYQAGKKREVIDYKGFRFLFTICFDLRFPVFCANNNDYDVLLNIASWPSARSDHWQKLLVARAIENQAYVIACNRVGFDPNCHYSGDSAIIDYNGKIMVQNKNNEVILSSTLNLAQLNMHKEKFNFLVSQDKYKLFDLK